MQPKELIFSTFGNRWNFRLPEVACKPQSGLNLGSEEVFVRASILVLHLMIFNAGASTDNSQHEATERNSTTAS